jgi:tryptophan synthase alpha chain
MSRLSSVLKPGHKVLIPYITVGYPDLDTTKKAAFLLAENGADIIELGIPFSDPMADGATIQESSFQALQNGVTIETCLATARELRETIKAPLVFMTYYNPVLKYGIDKFCNACRNADVDGLIIPDLPPEEGSTLESATKEHALDLVYLLAPTSTPERIKLVARKSRGFIYLVSVAGVTGTRHTLPITLENFIGRVRNVARQPLYVGFGISTPEQVRQIASVSDGVIIGSKLIQLMKSDPTLTDLKRFIKEIRITLDSIE